MVDTDTATAAKPVRFAVIGLGHIAQAAVLPAFRNTKGCTLSALVSSDPLKRKKLGRKYKVPAFAYEQLEECLASGEVDAVFIALPNSLHCEYTVRAAEAGAHVLCEKPMAVTEDECRKMIEVARLNSVRLMIAYRLHFEEANLKAVELVRSGSLGEPRIFSSEFTMQVKEGNIRLKRELGGGTLYDIGIYCINAARYLFRSEPTHVLATAAFANQQDDRFAEVDEMTSVVLRFPEDRLAHFTCSFGAADVSSYRIIGTEGELRMDPAYDYSARLAQHLTVGGKTKKHTFPKRDQFAAELTYFANCVAQGCEPEPSGLEGLADVRIIEALLRSAQSGKWISLEPVAKYDRPDVDQQIRRAVVNETDESELVHAQSPSH